MATEMGIGGDTTHVYKSYFNALADSEGLPTHFYGYKWSYCVILGRIPGRSKKPELSIKFKKTGKKTTVSVDNMVSVLNLQKVPAKPTTQYAQSVVGFEKLGSGDPWNSVDSLGASLKNRFGFLRPYHMTHIWS